MPHIVISDQCKSTLDKLKRHPRASYCEVIEDLIKEHSANSKSVEPDTGIDLEPIPQAKTEQP